MGEPQRLPSKQDVSKLVLCVADTSRKLSSCTAASMIVFIQIKIEMKDCSLIHVPATLVASLAIRLVLKNLALGTKISNEHCQAMPASLPDQSYPPSIYCQPGCGQHTGSGS